MLWGARISIAVGIVPVILATVTGVPLGLMAAYYGGWFGTLVMRLIDIFFAFPMVLLGVALGAVLGAGTVNLIITLTVVFLPFITRVVFRATEQVKREEYVLAAKICGARDRNLIWGQILPNIMSSVVVYATTNIGLMIVFGSGLSFLGVGVQPPTSEWGVMVSSGMRYLSVAPQVSTVPGLAILLTALGFNLIGDALRDALDPRQRRTIERV
jgi:ABC-type dipeptide/oligopeptide/nickel transport system permease subunit